LERIEIIRDLRIGTYDVLVGINLLREGLDIPEVSLVAILDADKEGFLRSERSLIQTMGRAARNENGEVIMYADQITQSMQVAIDETNRRRDIQQAFNEKHNITPTTIKKEVRDVIRATIAVEDQEEYNTPTMSKKKVRDVIRATSADEDQEEYKTQTKKLTELTKKEKEKTLENMEKEMKDASKALDFEKAAELRDIIFELKADKLFV